jgi:DNA polymerase I-like protein with 3'-5' exonuclease and polymerase domains
MTPIFAEIEYNGLNVDSQTLDVLNMQLDNKIKDKEFEIRALSEVSTEDNLNSTQDLVDILFTREGSCQLYPPVNTAKGKPSVNSECIDILLEQIDEELESR